MFTIHLVQAPWLWGMSPIDNAPSGMLPHINCSTRKQHQQLWRIITGRKKSTGIGDHYWSSHWFSNKQHYLSLYRLAVRTCHTRRTLRFVPYWASNASRQVDNLHRHTSSCLFAMRIQNSRLFYKQVPLRIFGTGNHRDVCTGRNTRTELGIFSDSKTLTIQDSWKRYRERSLKQSFLLTV